MGLYPPVSPRGHDKSGISSLILPYRRRSPPPRPPDPPPEELEIEGNRPQAGLEGSQGTLCSLFASSLLFFVPLASFGTILVLFWHPWDLKNIAFSLRGSSNSSFSLFSWWKPPWDTKLTSKSSKCSAQAPQMVPQRSPGALKSVPGEFQKPPKTTPREHFGDPWASKNPQGVVLGVSGPHFGPPRVSFT